MYNAFYALIQFCPDDARGEVANVGVAFTCPEAGVSKVLLGDNVFSRRLLKNSFFTGDSFNLLREGFANRLRETLSKNHSKEVLSAFRPSGANPIRLSDVREMLLADPLNVGWMLDKFVLDKKAKVTRSKPVAHELRLALVARGLESKLRTDVTVRVPALNSDLKAPYAYKNGRLNLIEPANFAVPSGDRTMEVASWLAIAGQSITASSKASPEEKHLIVIGRLNSERSEDGHRIAELLHSHEVDFYPMSEDGFDALARRIEAEAH